MKTINKLTISTLNPCKDRFDNYVKHYGDKEFTPRQFMGLKNITHEDKMWVALRLIHSKYIRFVASDIAQTVLHLFEKYHPYDFRPRVAIKMARENQAVYNASVYNSVVKATAYVDSSAAAVVAADAAHVAYAAYSVAVNANAAYSYDDAASVVSAAYAATNAAANDAINSAATANDVISVAAASNVAVNAVVYAYVANVRLKQEKLQRTIVLKYWLKDEK